MILAVSCPNTSLSKRSGEDKIHWKMQSIIVCMVRVRTSEVNRAYDWSVTSRSCCRSIWKLERESSCLKSIGYSDWIAPIRSTYSTRSKNKTMQNKNCATTYLHACRNCLRWQNIDAVGMVDEKLTIMSIMCSEVRWGLDIFASQQMVIKQDCARH